jgi:hypothetical protein
MLFSCIAIRDCITLSSIKDLSPSFEVKKLLTVANKIGYSFALVVIAIFENLSLICLGWMQKSREKKN